MIRKLSLSFSLSLSLRLSLFLSVCPQVCVCVCVFQMSSSWVKRSHTRRAAGNICAAALHTAAMCVCPLCVCYCWRLQVTLSHTLTHSLTLLHTHRHTHSLTHSLTHSHTHTHSHSISHSDIHTHTLSGSVSLLSDTWSDDTNKCQITTVTYKHTCVRTHTTLTSHTHTPHHTHTNTPTHTPAVSLHMHVRWFQHLHSALVAFFRVFVRFSGCCLILSPAKWVTTWCSLSSLKKRNLQLWNTLFSLLCVYKGLRSRMSSVIKHTSEPDLSKGL